MQYRVRIDAAFDSGTDADKLKAGIIALQGKLKRINAVETSTIMVEKCFHDEIPPKPCEILYQWTKE